MEWQYQLLYFSLPCLDGILAVEFFDHFSLLVDGIFLLLKDIVTPLDVQTSTDWLVRFVVGVQFLYSDKEMTFNLHQLIHLPKSVVLHGPLWAHFCFGFVTSMGLLKELVQTAKGVPSQIMTRVMSKNSFQLFKTKSSLRV